MFCGYQILDSGLFNFLAVFFVVPDDNGIVEGLVQLTEGTVFMLDTVRRGLEAQLGDKAVQH